MKYCYNCGKEVLDEAIICVGCGVSLNNKKTTNFETDVDNVIYLLIGLFVPLVGLILWLIWRDEYPNRAHNCGKGALISVIAGAVISTIVLFLSFAGMMLL